MGTNYPRAEFRIYDESDIPALEVNVTDRSPMFLYAITSDKGSEELQIVERRFVDHYGTPSFEKHGQPSLQAAITLMSEGRLLVKRVVSEDATLANTCVVAKVKKGEETETPKLDEHGDPMYLLEEGDEVAIPEGEEIPDGATAIMTNKAEVLYETMSVKDAKNEDDILSVIEALEDTDGEYEVFPLFTITDNGRGKSKKKFRVVPDYGTSRSYDYTIYRLNVIEDGRTIEQFAFSMDPNRIHLGESFSLTDVVGRISIQIKAAMSNTGILGFVNKLEEITGLDNLILDDFLFGNRKDQRTINEIVVDEGSVNLTDTFGISLDNGDYGAMGDIPTENPDEVEALYTDFFAGKVDDNIYDMEKYPICGVIDANYPFETKDAIEELCSFREDMFFFADVGTDMFTLSQFKNRMDQVAKIREVSHYGVSYDVIDDFSRKQIPVTIGYSLAKLLPGHLRSGAHIPFAGKLHNAILHDAIEGTVNFIPKVTPVENQKEMLNDMRLNYVSYLDDELIVQTLYTANYKHTQLSYSNNVLLAQEMIRDIRKRCPASRYSFIHGEDLENYQSSVEKVLTRHENKFRSLSFEYLQDDTMEQNKIYYAAIRVQFKDFVQAEIFNIHAISNIDIV